MKIRKLLSQLSINVREIDGHFLLIVTLVIKYLKVKTCIVTFKQYCTLSFEQNFLFDYRRRKTTLIFVYALYINIKITQLLSKLSIKVREIDGYFILIGTLVIKYLKIKACIVTLKLYSNLSVELNFLLILEEEKQQ